MYQIAVCDNDTTELTHTCELVEKFRNQHPEADISLRRFSSGADLTEALENGKQFHLYLLDILMPEPNGIQIGKKIREKDKYSVILYLSTSAEFALESYHVRARDYLLKPLKESELFCCLAEALVQCDSLETGRLLIRTKNGLESIAYPKLVYIEYLNHRIYCHLFDGECVESTWQRQPFHDLADSLAKDGRFLKISASHVINMQHVRTITVREFIMTDGTHLSITRTYYGARQKYMDYILERGMQL